LRLLLINPNMTAAVTERLAEVGRAVANPDTEIVALTASRGFPYISARSEAEIAGVLAMEMIADHAEGADAAIIAAFGDPGLFAARELFDFPVVGMSEAAMRDYVEDLAATMLASTLGIEFNPDAAWDERKRVYELSDLIVDSLSITASAEGAANGDWTCAVSAAVFRFAIPSVAP